MADVQPHTEPAGLDALLRGSSCDGLVERPLDRLCEPRIAAEINGCSSGVDAGYEVVRDAQDHLLGHLHTIADLIADSRSDSIAGMTTKPVDPTAVNWNGNLRELTDDDLSGRIHALALYIANDAAAGRVLDSGAVAGFRAAADERDRGRH